MDPEGKGMLQRVRHQLVDDETAGNCPIDVEIDTGLDVEIDVHTRWMTEGLMQL